MGTERPPHRRARTGAGLHARSQPGSKRGARSTEPRLNDLHDSARLQALAAEGGLPVEELLREVADLRLALATDLTIAAAAVDADAFEIASEVVDGDRIAVGDFRDRVNDLLATPPSRPTTGPAERSTRPGLRRPAPLIAVAAGLVFLLGGIVTGPGFSEPNRAPNQLALDAQARYLDFSRLVGSNATAAQVIAASSKLHDSLASLVFSDPTTVANILNSEQLLLLSSDPAGTNVILADVQALVRRLRASAPAGAAAVLDSVVIAPTPRSSASAKPKPTPSPAPSATPSPKPTSRPSPSPSATPQHSGGPTPTPTPLIVPPRAP